ncbi:hypothetical protein PspLS_08262, partial [Pyricularia sp. CBS 133598]
KCVCDICNKLEHQAKNHAESNATQGNARSPNAGSIIRLHNKQQGGLVPFSGDRIQRPYRHAGQGPVEAKAPRAEGKPLFVQGSKYCLRSVGLTGWTGQKAACQADATMSSLSALPAALCTASL